MLDQPGITAAQMRRLLESGEDHKAVLARFVGALDAEGEQALEALLRAARSERADPE